MKTLVAISGGAKSLVTAWLLKKQGMQVRGVYFDVFGGDRIRDGIHEVERRLGIPIQVIESGSQIGQMLLDDQKRSMLQGFPFDPASQFQRKYMLPKLVEMRAEMKFEKIATGHTVTLQEDMAAGVVRVVQGPEFDLRSISLLFGMSQKDLATLLTPVGSIPSAMLEKIKNEVAPASLTDGFELDWSSILEKAGPVELPPPGQLIQVITSAGVVVGDFERSRLKLGDFFHDPQSNGSVFRIIDILPATGKALIQEANEIRFNEFSFDSGHWFTRDDLGMAVLDAGMLWAGRKKPVSIKLIQFEGNRMKGVLNESLVGDEADIFKGETVVWLQGSEILGGAKVLRLK